MTSLKTMKYLLLSVQDFFRKDRYKFFRKLERNELPRLCGEIVGKSCKYA